MRGYVPRCLLSDYQSTGEDTWHCPEECSKKSSSKLVYEVYYFRTRDAVETVTGVPWISFRLNYLLPSSRKWKSSFTSRKIVAQRSSPDIPSSTFSPPYSLVSVGAYLSPYDRWRHTAWFAAARFGIGCPHRFSGKGGFGSVRLNRTSDAVHFSIGGLHHFSGDGERVGIRIWGSLRRTDW